MKNLYYQLFDRTRKPEDPNFAHFGKQPICNDFAGVVEAFAKHNRVAVSDVRMFFYETKEQWQRAERVALASVNWDIPILP